MFRCRYDRNMNIWFTFVWFMLKIFKADVTVKYRVTILFKLTLDHVPNNLSSILSIKRIFFQVGTNVFHWPGYITPFLGTNHITWNMYVAASTALFVIQIAPRDLIKPNTVSTLSGLANKIPDRRIPVHYSCLLSLLVDHVQVNRVALSRIPCLDRSGSNIGPMIVRWLLLSPTLYYCSVQWVWLTLSPIISHTPSLALCTSFNCVSVGHG